MNPITFIPDNAPFTPDQRAWLNGFFAGVFGVVPNANAQNLGDFPLSVASGPSFTEIDGPNSTHEVAAAELSDTRFAATEEISAAETSTALEHTLGVVEEESESDDFPWHDPTLEMDERLELAKDRPFKRQLMAAMAQLDCGACGYICQTYSEAIASGEEASLNLCAPGGSDTEAQLEKMMASPRALPIVKVTSPIASQAKASANAKPSAPPAVANGSLQSETAVERIGFDRKHPIVGHFAFARPLNRAGSTKDTRHVSIRFEHGAPAYRPGDALGVYPSNSSELVEQIIDATKLSGEDMVTSPLGLSKTLFNALKEDACLKAIPDPLSKRIAAGSDPSLRDLNRSGDVLDVLKRNPVRWENAQEFIGLLRPLQPRLYSISSSPKKFPDQIHLTVARVQWQSDNRTKLGVASTMLADRLEPGQPLRVFVHRPQAFAMPIDPSVPMIMVGPGTGIAPFIAFVQERQSMQARGKNWLFFGDQHAECDFLYEEQLNAWKHTGLLRLDTAFSRDQAEKIYVQDRMLANGREIFEWLEAGAHFYVCGDAKSMAASVHQALQNIVSTFGRVTAETAEAYLKSMQQQRRYQRDVY